MHKLAQTSLGFINKATTVRQNEEQIIWKVINNCSFGVRKIFRSSLLGYRFSIRISDTMKKLSVFNDMEQNQIRRQCKPGARIERFYKEQFGY